MSSTTARASRYEVDVDFLQVKDERGHRHFLKRGADLPDWVVGQQLAELIESRVIFEYGVI